MTKGLWFAVVGMVLIEIANLVMAFNGVSIGWSILVLSPLAAALGIGAGFIDVRTGRKSP